MDEPLKMPEPAPEPPKKQKRHWLKTTIKCIAILLTLVIVGAFGSLYWICQTDSGHAWLLKTINSALALKPGEQGLGFRLTSLSGSLPFNFEMGLESSDARGLWLEAPTSRFKLNWRNLPGTIHIQELALANPDILRFPEIPPSPPAPAPEKPFTLEDFQRLLAQTADFLNTSHWWLPAINVESVKVERALLPASVLPQDYKINPRPLLDAALTASLIDNAASASLSLSIKNGDSSPMALQTVRLEGLSTHLNLDISPANGGLEAKAKLSSKISQSELSVAGLPKTFLGNNPEFNLEINGAANTDEIKPGLSIAITGPNLDAGHIHLKGDGKWHSGADWGKGGLSGPLSYALALTTTPPNPEELDGDHPLSMLHGPASLALDANGDLSSLNLGLNLACSQLEQAGHTIADANLKLDARDIRLPLNSSAVISLEKENRLDLDLSAFLDKHPIALSTQLFFQAQKNGENALDWLAAMREFKLDALGLKGAGGLAAKISPGQKPALTGNLDFSISEWKALTSFAPNQQFSGAVNLAVNLANDFQSSQDEGKNSQTARIKLHIPAFALNSGPDSAVAIKDGSGDILLTDLLEDPAVDGEIKVANIGVAGMNIEAGILARGKFSGPLTADITTSKSVRSKINGVWEPGKVALNTLNVEMNMPGGKGARLGARARQPATLAYGEGGISVSGLDLQITPSGSLKANGGFSSQKLDLNLNLTDLEFKPWQALVAELPAGRADIKVNLGGSPGRPTGGFQLNLAGITVPGVALKPVGLSLKGNVENSASGSALNARLEIDKATLRTLGASEAGITASLPLLFGVDGVPKPDMNGKLNARIHWDGALGPIWNLLPMPDMRLNGRVNINIDAGGTLTTPQLRGGVKVDKARYEDLMLGVLLTDINLRLNLAEDHNLKTLANGIPGHMTLALNASDGRGGTVAVNGKGGLNGKDLDITAKIDRLKPLRRRDVHVELSGSAKVGGEASAPQIAGELVVNQGDVLLDNLDFSSSVTTLPITEVSTSQKKPKKSQNQIDPKQNAKNPAPPSGSGSLNIKITMLPRFVVEGRGLTSNWKADLLVGGTPEDPRITGNISSVKGNFDFLGKVFTITKGVVFFGGGSISNPLIDMELTYDTTDLEAHILVNGPVDKIKLTLSSDPQMPRDEILSRVLFGRSVSDLSRLEMLQLAGAVAQLAGFGSGGGILSMAKKTLGVDVLRLGTSSDSAGQPGDQTAGGTTIEMGKYINDMIYMGVQQGLQPDSTAFIIQLELTPRTSLEVKTEQNNTWGGLKWKYNY